MVLHFFVGDIVFRQSNHEGDLVDCLRYDMGKCKLILEGTEWFYESVETGERVSYVKMIDAITTKQKVRKITSQ